MGHAEALGAWCSRARAGRWVWATKARKHKRTATKGKGFRGSAFRVFVAHCFYSPDRVQVRQDPRALAPPRGQCRSSRLPAALAGDWQLQLHRPRGGAETPRAWREPNAARAQRRVCNAKAQRTPRLYFAGLSLGWSKRKTLKPKVSRGAPWRPGVVCRSDLPKVPRVTPSPLRLSAPAWLSSSWRPLAVLSGYMRRLPVTGNYNGIDHAEAQRR